MKNIAPGANKKSAPSIIAAFLSAGFVYFLMQLKKYAPQKDVCVTKKARAIHIDIYPFIRNNSLTRTRSTTKRGANRALNINPRVKYDMLLSLFLLTRNSISFTRFPLIFLLFIITTIGLKAFEHLIKHKTKHKTKKDHWRSITMFY